MIGCKKSQNRTVNSHSAKKNVAKVPSRGVLTLSDEPNNQLKQITGYIYRKNNDYLILNASEDFLQNSSDMEKYLKMGVNQQTSTYFVRPNTFAMGQDQVGNHSKLFKMAYGSVTYDELPESDRLGVSFDTVTNENLNELPKIKIYKIIYKRISN